MHSDSAASADHARYKLKALIFDVDGTLAETEELHRRAFNEAFAAAGLDWVWDPALYCDLLKVTGGKERIRHFVDVYRNRSAMGSPAAAIDANFIRSLHEDKTRRYTSMVAEGLLPLRPGVARVLAEARRHGVRLAIATTTSRANVDALLDACLDNATFEAIAAGDEVAAKKPAPDIYHLALRRLGLGPADCLAIEDSAAGLQSALRAGLPCVITRSAYGSRGSFEGACAVLESLGEATEPPCIGIGELAAMARAPAARSGSAVMD